jgi:hypothetical protein
MKTNQCRSSGSNILGQYKNNSEKPASAGFSRSKKLGRILLSSSGIAGKKQINSLTYIFKSSNFHNPYSILTSIVKLKRSLENCPSIVRTRKILGQGKQEMLAGSPNERVIGTGKAGKVCWQSESKGYSDKLSKKYLFKVQV